MFNSFIFLSSKLIHLFPHFLLSLCTYVKLNCLLKMQKKERKSNNHTHLSKTDTSQDVNDLNVWGGY